MPAILKKKSMAIIAATLLILCRGAYAEGPFEEMGVIKPSTRVEAPGFSLTSLDGSISALSDTRGKVVLLHFWATWCLPCKDEMPAIERLWEKFKGEDFIILAVAVDRGKPKKVRKFSKKHGITFPILLDPKGSTRKTYEVSALPTSYIIGKDGRISGKVLGAKEWDKAEAVSFFEELLNR